MAGNYRKKNSPRRNSNWLGQLLLISVVFVAGYMSAALYNLASLSAWMGTHVLAKGSIQPIITSGLQQAQLPKPKFEFYTLLANEQVAGATQATAAAQVSAAAQTPSAQTIIAAAPAKALPLHAPLAPVAAVVATAGPAPVVAAADKISAVLTNTRDAYLVQVASFKSMREAERMKVSLVMKGFDVKIATVNQQHVNWYRVIIGPFGSKTQAQQAQLAFARSEHIMGMIRKMDA